MPLSDREQQILKEIERNLLADAPEGVIPDDDKSRGRKRIKAGIFLLVAGLACLGLFFMTGALGLGVVAFAAMVGGLLLFTNGLKESAVNNFRDLSYGRSSELFGRWDQHFRNRNKRS